MYAKLVFPTTVTAGQVIRDVVRLIRDSGTGAASLANLQYITVGSSELIAGTNSGWTIHSSTPLNTGAQSITDNRYILQGTAANGVAKYVGIYANYDWTNAGSWSSTTSCGFTMGAVQDPGTATVWYGTGYSQTTVSISKNASLWVNSSTVTAGGQYDCTLWVFADPRRIILIGVDGSGYSQIQSYMEFAPTPVSTTWKGLPPVAYCRWSPLQAGGSSGTVTDAFGYRGATWENNTSTAATMLQFPGSLWSVPGNSVVRSYTLWHGAISHGSYSGDNRTCFLANNTALGAAQTTVSLVGNGLNNPGTGYYGDSNDKDFWGGCYMRTSVSDQVSNQFQSGRRTYDGSGNVALPLYPIVFRELHHFAEIFNFSSVNGIYWTFNGQGLRGDTVTAGADVYYYFPMWTTAYMGAFIIKRT